MATSSNQTRIPKPDAWFRRLSDATLEKVIGGSLGIAWTAREIAARTLRLRDARVH